MIVDLNIEIREIGRLLMSAAILQEIRREVASVMKDGFVVTDGRHHELGAGYDVIVKCGSEDRMDVLRRIRGKVANVDVEKIADGVIGVRVSRRMRGLKGF